MSGNIMSMIRQTLQASREKLAADRQDKTGIVVQQEKKASAELPAASEVEKIAQACLTLADSLPEVVDDRPPQQKIATLLALKSKMAEGMADANTSSPHQSKMSPDKPEMNPPMDDGQAPGGPGTAMKSEQNMAQGTGIEAGQSGQAQEPPPMKVEPSEKANPMDASNALSTNMADAPGAGESAPMKIAAYQELFKLAREGKISHDELAKMAMHPKMKEQMKKVQDAQDSSPGAEKPGGGDLKKQAILDLLSGIQASRGRSDAAEGLTRGVGGALRSAGKGLVGGAAGAGAGALAGRALGGKGGQDLGARLGALAGGIGGGAHGLYDESVRAGQRVADMQVAKTAEDALNPAQISAPTKPELQDAPGVPSPLSQGSEAGQMTPPGPSDSRRSLVQSNEGPINATKRDTNHVKDEMSAYLRQPAMSRANDSSLHQSLDNADSAGVKIAAIRQMLKKWAAEAPENGVAMAQVVDKVAMGGMGGMPMADGAPPAGGMAPPPPAAPGAGGDMGMPMGKMGEDPMDVALAAAASGVTPELLEAAMMAMQGEAMGAEPMPPEMMEAPPAEPPPVEPPAEGPPADGPPPPKKDDPEDSPPAKEEE